MAGRCAPVILAVDCLVQSDGRLLVNEINDRPGGLADASCFESSNALTGMDHLAHWLVARCPSARLGFLLNERFILEGQGCGTGLEMPSPDVNAKESVAQIDALMAALRRVNPDFLFAFFAGRHPDQALSDYPVVYIRSNRVWQLGDGVIPINSFACRGLFQSKLGTFRALRETALGGQLVPTYDAELEDIDTFIERHAEASKGRFIVKPDRGSKGSGVRCVKVEFLRERPSLRRLLQASRLVLQPFVVPFGYRTTAGHDYALELRLFFVDEQFAGAVVKRAFAPFSRFGLGERMAWLADGGYLLPPSSLVDCGAAPMATINRLIDGCEQAIRKLDQLIEGDADQLLADYIRHEAASAHVRARARPVACRLRKPE
jgi:hypothetical protein